MNEQPSNERLAEPAVEHVENRQSACLPGFDARFLISVSNHPRVQTISRRSRKAMAKSTFELKLPYRLAFAQRRLGEDRVDADLAHAIGRRTTRKRRRADARAAWRHCSYSC